MAILVTPNLTDISLCEVVTGWSAGAVNSDYALQGTYCLGIQVKATTSAINSYTFGTAANMTGKHIYIWMMVAGLPDTKANGGYRIYVETDASNYGVWYVAGKDTFPGGWGCFVIDPASTPTTGLGTVNPASVAKIGVQFKTLSTIAGTTLNCFWDACRYGTGLTITSGATDAIDFEDIFAVDDNTTYKYGVVTKAAGGAYLIQGKLIFGGTVAENIDFVDTNQIVLFPSNSFVSDTFYGITVQCGTGTTNFTLGEKSGTAGIKGCVLKAAGTKKFSVDLSDTDNDKIQLYGSSFINAGVITLLPTATNREVLNCSFDTCSEMVVNTCIMTNCNFISAAAASIKISSTSFNVTESNFISCVNGTLIDTVGTYPFDALMFTGCTYDVNNTSGSEITVQKLNGSNPTTYTGSLVTFTAPPVDTTVVVKTSDTPPVAIQDARVLVLAATGGQMPYDVTVTIVNSDTTATVTHTAHGMATNDKVQIKGASLQANNGVFTITKIDVDSYTYTMSSTPGSSPTGTIKSTYAALYGLTDVNGEITMSRMFLSDQPITGRIRKSTSSPFYKTSNFIGTIDSTTGFSNTIQMIPDV